MAFEINVNDVANCQLPVMAKPTANVLITAIILQVMDLAADLDLVLVM